MDLIDIGEGLRFRCRGRGRFLIGLVIDTSTIEDPSVKSSPSEDPPESESVTRSMTGIVAGLLDSVDGVSVLIVGIADAGALGPRGSNLEFGLFGIFVPDPMLTSAPGAEVLRR